MASNGRSQPEGGGRGIMGLPALHLLVAAGIALAFIMIGTVWSANLPSQVYVGTSLLFFDRAAAAALMPPEMGQSRSDAKGFADAILSDEMAEMISSQFGLSGGSKETAVAQFRSSLSLSDESTSSLRITWRGGDRGQTIAVTNAIAVLLTSGTPKLAGPPQELVANPPSPPKTPASATVLTPPEQGASSSTAFLRQVMQDVETLKREQTRRSAEFVTLDRRLATLAEESRSLQSRIHMEEAERQAAMATRQTVAAQLAAEKNTLEMLRQRYTDAYPDVVAARERVAKSEKKLNAISAEHSAPNSDQRRLVAVTKEIQQLGEEKARLLSVATSAGQPPTDLQRQESAVERNDTASASGGRGPLPSTSSEFEAPSAPMVHDETSRALEGEHVRPFRVLERASYAQPLYHSRSMITWMSVLAGLTGGVLYLAWSWRSRRVRDNEIRETIAPGNVA